MFVRAADLTDATIRADIAIFGAGAAGISLAKALTERGHDVLLVEGGGMAEDDALQTLFGGESIGEPILANEGRYRVFGGTTIAWTGRIAPLDPIDFEARPWVRDSGWPIAPDALDQWLPEAAALIGHDPPWDVAPARLPAVRALPGRPPELDLQVWRFRSFKRDWFRNFGEMVMPDFAVKARPRVLIEADLVGLVPHDGGKGIAQAVLRTRDERKITVIAHDFALCCGGIENTRLLLNFAAATPAAFAPVADSIGRRFMQHPRAPTATIHATATQANQLQRHFNLFRRPGKHQEIGFALNARTQRARGLLNASAVLRYAPRPIEPPHLIFRRALRWSRGWERRLHAPDISLHVDVEQVPDPDSRITLLPRRDAIGLHDIAIDWRIDPLDRATAAAMTDAACAWIERLGWGRTEPVPDLAQTGGLTRERMLESYHHLGGTRMSASPATGVVDGDLKVHGLANLHICGGSVMPTGGHVNPTLTIVALALRLAARLSARRDG